MNNKTIVTAIVIVAIVAVAGYLIYNAGPVVSAQGSSTLKVQPDEISVYVTIETRNASAVEAKNANTEISDRVLTELIKLGFDRDEVKFVNYNEYPEYDWSGGSQKFKGYVVSQQLVVKMSDFDKVSEVIDASTDAGALVSSINFELSDKKQSYYKTQALTEAGQDAKAKAEATAAGVGKRLGRLVSVQSENFDYRPWNYYSYGGVMTASADNAEAMKAVSTLASLGPQDQEVSATISVQYKMSLF